MTTQHDIRPTIIMGLGNPDPSLAETYHNAGILAVRHLAERAAIAAGGGAPEFKRYKDLFSYASIGGTTFVLPLVYMNDSGRAAKEALRVLGATPADIAIAHDDSDIAIGEFKFARGGRAAGHKGIQSIIDHLKTEDFARIRIGIREPNEERRKKAGDFVLSPISKKDMDSLAAVFAKLPPLIGK
jgi:peptidyl-tRNA hydrolase, PTH1 family